MNNFKTKIIILFVLILITLIAILCYNDKKNESYEDLKKTDFFYIVISEFFDSYGRYPENYKELYLYLKPHLGAEYLDKKIKYLKPRIETIDSNRVLIFYNKDEIIYSDTLTHRYQQFKFLLLYTRDTVYNDIYLNNYFRKKIKEIVKKYYKINFDYNFSRGNFIRKRVLVMFERDNEYDILYTDLSDIKKFRNLFNDIEAIIVNDTIEKALVPIILPFPKE